MAKPEMEMERKDGGVFGGGCCGFRMPLHYPRYKKADYESMPEWRVDCLLAPRVRPPQSIISIVYTLTVYMLPSACT
jgi:hypothetical protein